MAQERAKRDLNPRRLFQLATQGSDLVMALPHRIDLITERMAANEFELRMQVPQLVEVMRGMQKVANRVFSGLVLSLHERMTKEMSRETRDRRNMETSLSCSVIRQVPLDSLMHWNRDCRVLHAICLTWDLE